jgi:hypothetical protein
VRHGTQTGGDRAVEVRLELRARNADLGSAETEGDQALRPQVDGEPGGLLRGLEPCFAAERASSMAAMKAFSSMPRRVELNGVMVSSA